MLLRVAALLLAASAPATTDDSATAAKRLPAAVPLGACTVSLGSNATASEQFAAAELSTIGGNISAGDPLPIQRGEAGGKLPAHVPLNVRRIDGAHRAGGQHALQHLKGGPFEGVALGVRPKL